MRNLSWVLALRELQVQLGALEKRRCKVEGMGAHGDCRRNKDKETTWRSRLVITGP